MPVPRPDSRLGAYLAGGQREPAELIGQERVELVSFAPQKSFASRDGRLPTSVGWSRLVFGLAGGFSSSAEPWEFF